VTHLSDEAVVALAQHVGYLNLSSLATLSDEGAVALSRHDGAVSLMGVNEMSDEAVGVLRASSRVFLPPKYMNSKLP
jgi:hypothetical protein